MNENSVFSVGSWVGDVEIITFASILHTDIYVANDYYIVQDDTREIRLGLKMNRASI